MHKTQPTLSPKANLVPNLNPKTIPNPNPNPKPTPNPYLKNRLKSLKNKRSTDGCTSVPNFDPSNFRRISVVANEMI